MLPVLLVLSLLPLGSCQPTTPPPNSFSSQAAVLLNPNPCASSAYIVVGSKVASSCTVNSGAGFTLGTMQAYIYSIGTTAGVTLAIYSNSGGKPFTRLGGTNGTLSTGYGGTSATAVYGIPTPPVVLAGGATYWAALETATTNYVCSDPSGGSVQFPQASYPLPTSSWRYALFSSSTGGTVNINAAIVEVRGAWGCV